MRKVIKFVKQTTLFLLLAFLFPILIYAQDECLVKSEVRVVKKSFEWQEADYIYGIPKSLAIGDEATITGKWGLNIQKFPNAQYKVLIGYVDDEADESKMWGLGFFDTKFVDQGGPNRAFSINFTPPENPKTHNWVKLQITCVAQNDNDPNSPRFLVTEIHKIPLIGDLKGAVIYVGYDFQKKEYIHSPVKDQFANLLQGSTLLQYSRTSDNGCFNLNYPKEAGDYKLQILDNSGDVYFRVFTSVRPAQIVCWIPRILYNQMDALNKRLEEPTFVTDMFYGTWKPTTRLLTNYFTTEVYSLVSDNCHFEGDYTKSLGEENDSIRADKIIRAYLTEILVDSVFQNTQKLSGETIKILTDACMALFYYKDFIKATDELMKKVGGSEVDKYLTKKILSGAELEFGYRFIEDFIYRMKLTGNWKVAGEVIKNCFNVLKGAMSGLAGKKPKESIYKILMDEAIKNAVLWPGNQIMLSAYVVFSQDIFDEGIKFIKTSEMLGTHIEAQASLEKVVQKNIEDIKTFVSDAKEKKMTSNWLSTLAAIGIALVGILALVFGQLEISLPAFIASATQIFTLVKSLSVATIVMAAAKLLVAVGEQGAVIDEGVQAIVSPTTKIIKQMPDRVKNDKIALISDLKFYNDNKSQIITLQSNYINLLDESIVLADKKDIPNLKLKYAELSEEELKLNCQLNKVQMIYYTIADSIIKYNPEIDKKFTQFNDFKQKSELNRLIMDLFFFQQFYQTNPVPTTDTLKLYADSVKRDIPFLISLADELLIETSKYHIPAKIIISEKNQTSGLLPAGKPFDIKIKLQNIGSENSGKLVCIFKADSSAKVLSDTSTIIDNFNSDETKDFSWNLVVEDSTIGTCSYNIKLIKNDTVILDETDIVYFDAKEPPVAVPGEIIYSTCSINKIIPDPVKNSARVSITVPENLSFSKLSVINIQGFKLAEFNVDLSNAGEYFVDIDLRDFVQGIYFLNLTTNMGSTNKRFVIIK